MSVKRVFTVISIKKTEFLIGRAKSASEIPGRSGVGKKRGTQNF